MCATSLFSKRAFWDKMKTLFTVNFESIVGLEVTGSHLTENRKHVQEVVQGHVSLSVLRENLCDPLAKWVVLIRKHRIFRVV